MRCVPQSQFQTTLLSQNGLTKAPRGARDAYEGSVSSPGCGGWAKDDPVRRRSLEPKSKHAAPHIHQRRPYVITNKQVILSEVLQ